MIKFALKDTTTAFEAVEWCIERFSNEDWSIQMSAQGWQTYTFEFKNQHDATLFGLAWSEHV